MSTRCQLGFYSSPSAPVEKPDAVLYRHCDGYPDTESGVLATLIPWAQNFARRRGLKDSEYAAARALVALVQAHVPDDVLSYGICNPADELHGDIEYYYRVDPSGITVYDMPFDQGWPCPKTPKQFIPISHV